MDVELKGFQLQAGAVPGPRWGLRSLTQLEAPLPAPRYRLALAMVNCS